MTQYRKELQDSETPDIVQNLNPKIKPFGCRNFKSDWNFNPVKPWPSTLPTMTYNDQRLCAFDRWSESEILVPLNTEIPPWIYIQSLYGELSFPELARLSHCLKINEKSLTCAGAQSSVKTDVNTQEISGQASAFWSHFGFRWRDTLQDVVDRVVQMPLTIQSLLQEKKMGPQDLAPLRSLQRMEELEPFWDLLLTLPFSKSEWVKSLEILIELLLLKTPIEVLTPRSPQIVRGSDWLLQLQELRWPRALQSDQMNHHKLKTIAWPHRSEAKWTRRGDLSGIELKMFFSHPQELKRSLIRMEQVYKDLESNSNLNDLWVRS